MIESQESLKKEIQCLGEDVIYQAKMLLKSFDMSFWLEIGFLSFAAIIEIASACFALDLKILNFLSIFLTVSSLIFTIYFGLNQEIYKNRGEKYMTVYHELEHYFRSNEGKYKKSEIKEFCDIINSLNGEKKPGLFPFIKKLVECSILEETRHSGDKYPWWYFEQ